MYNEAISLKVKLHNLINSPNSEFLQVGNLRMLKIL